MRYVYNITHTRYNIYIYIGRNKADNIYYIVWQLRCAVCLNLRRQIGRRVPRSYDSNMHHAIYDNILLSLLNTATAVEVLAWVLVPKVRE